ncbi:MAG: hypothetical protein E7058_00105 [Lentisphaerae bacterium]|nr:hypothetical protein [Lentisphaerota bacterium]
MKKFCLILLLLTGGLIYAPRAQAEPVTMVILAPLALEGAKIASPHVIAAMQRGGRQMLEIGKDLGNLLRLPWGLCQATLGAPLGLFGQGVENMVIGVCAPFQLVGDVLILPLSFFGIGGGG